MNEMMLVAECKTCHLLWIGCAAAVMVCQECRSRCKTRPRRVFWGYYSSEKMLRLIEPVLFSVQKDLARKT